MKKSTLLTLLYGGYLGYSLGKFGGLSILDFRFWATTIVVVILVEAKVYYTIKESE